VIAHAPLDAQCAHDLPAPDPIEPRAQLPESVNAVFAKIVSGTAQPGDFATYVDLWDKLQAAQWRRKPKDH